MEDWTCTICDITMQMQSREAHLAGSRHKTAARGSWACLICNIEMQLQNRDAHLAGRRHAEAESERIAQAAVSHEAPLTWTCFICEIEMPIGNRDSHLAGKRHAAAVPPPNVTTASSSSKQANPVSVSSGMDGTIGTTNSNTSKSNLVSGGQCRICSGNVPSAMMQSHLRSLDHIQKVLEMLKITCMAIPQTEIQKPLKSSENLDYQDVVKGAKSLATYLKHQTAHKEGTAKSSSTSTTSNSKPTDKAKAKLPAKTASSPHPPTGPLDQFFLSFPGFQYDPSLPPADSFRTLRDGLSHWNDFEKTICSTWDEYKKDVYTRYQAALTREFNLWFGTDDDLASWHSLCRAIAIQPLPTTLRECEKAVRGRHVNIVDLIHWAREREVGQVRIFGTVKGLAKYTYEENKIYRKDQLEQGVVLRHLLRGIGEEYGRIGG